ncbi:tRNA adenine-N(1)--methyltransferase non-catalytic subunit [Polychaeton citri CBS 116435]|uniref:tRNA (adenine(58)-N(1))-methyltransferase non-catalytic subunit TRM6 n=1 Tax=Polychaeton citri CBS 116435 TaxID=1314669 RepID=A0A9P4Q649_9PEZI|nr:tRNA adenine-N(1)--methyltransferase non-catalytic subunit [Polychaeton citri CBS 116435]
MPHVHGHIRPHTFLFFRLPNTSLKLIEIIPNTIIDIGKFGSFPANLLLGRPYYHTYEILPPQDGEHYSRLRIVSPSELNAEIVTEQNASEGEIRSTPAPGGVDSLENYDLVDGDGNVIMKNNRLTIDDASRQALSHAEIEELKQSHGGKEIIAKILANHTGLDEKTDFSKAKYTLRKTKKYLKRFAVIPMDVPSLIEHMLDKEPSRIMECREETLGLVTSWSNVHLSLADSLGFDDLGRRVGGGRTLVVDETGGLLVAALAERKGLLWPDYEDPHPSPNDENKPPVNGETNDADGSQVEGGDGETKSATQHQDFPIPSPTNSITLLHPAVQPNLSLLKYFGYDSNNPDTSHPLHTHLKPLSFLQLLHPDEDPLYAEPTVIDPKDLSSLKSSRRGTYFKKRRRWERIRSIVDETREGGFDSLVIASYMDPITILPHTVPLLRGGAQVVIYSPTIESLKNVMDFYSRDRRLGYINAISSGDDVDKEDFPVDPRLLLAPTLQTTRVRQWQVLPGRTHPLMGSRGGSEGYFFTAHRAIPLEGGVEARGNYGKRRKVVSNGTAD